MELPIVLNNRKAITGLSYRRQRDAARSGRLAAGKQLLRPRLDLHRLVVPRKATATAYRAFERVRKAPSEMAA